MSALGLQPTVAKPDVSTQETVMRIVKSLIEDSIRNQPRSLQKQIGPSEIGNPCTHCLAARLAGWEKNESTIGWLAFIGTCVHAYLEDLFTELNKEETDAGLPVMFLAEQQVTVGQIRGVNVTGSTDLYMPDQMGTSEAGMTIDWKIVGDSTLNRVKRNEDPGEKYTAQAHLYAKGWAAAGHPTSHVCVYFMPRNKMSLDAGYWWIDEYRPEVADQALERANHLATNLDALATISAEVRDQWISSLDRDPACWDCKKYPDYHADTTGQTSLASVLNLK